ncbi:putative nucleotidyltransferase substrate binding domain-containing protein [Vibrio hannami]|uniref:putative nucleotidyltransferase substrate binding domain-containing protein n=1 Tax=Vibrio hannami TaxID=2717094 RepID=UPI00241000F9|nr:putative nucleotidyltransferase substrate binding domain-containing protein [Vibrio hannami]MDG3089005.1 putative nucleotidyltransferase substrate binding domain-containing protein [Vibrio hannami]
MSETLIPNIELFISGIDPFSRLPQPLLDRVTSSIKVIYLAKGEIIPPAQSDDDKYLYIVRTGAVEQRLNDGALRGKLEEEDVFGFSLFSESETRYQIKAIDNSLLYLVPSETIHHIQKQYPEYAEHFTAKPEDRIRSAVDSTWSDVNSSSFFNTVNQVASERFTQVDAESSIRDVAITMRSERTRCAMVLECGKLIGVITDADMTYRVVAEDINTSLPITQIMSPAPITISPDQTVFEAAISMMEQHIKHLPVVKDGKVVALLSLHQLFQNHRIQAIYLIDKIKKSRSEKELAKLAGDRNRIFKELANDKVPADLISTILSTIMDSFNQRLIDIAIDRLGPVPCDFAWIVSGSHARKEAHILSDQDSGIIMSNDATASDKFYFRHLAMIVTKGMALCGYELCSGKFMAVTPKWCQPLSVWQEYYKKWIKSPEYERLLNLSVFLDIRVIYGNRNFGDVLSGDFKEMTSERHFLVKLINDAAANRTPLGVFHNLVLTKNDNDEKTLNIKRYGINIIVDLARIYALSAKSDACNTRERLIDANKAGLMTDATLKNILSVYDFLNSFRFSYQVDQLNKGETPDNNINPDYFGSFERKHIKDAFRLIDDMQQAAKMRLN